VGGGDGPREKGCGGGGRGGTRGGAAGDIAFIGLEACAGFPGGGAFIAKLVVAPARANL